MSPKSELSLMTVDTNLLILSFSVNSKKLHYVFHVKSLSSSRSMLSSHLSELPDDQEEFDVPARRIFTDKYIKIMKEQGNVYHFLVFKLGHLC